MYYAEVLVDVANRRLDQSYHYSIPANIRLSIGMRVVVPLQNRLVQGLVVNISEKVPEEISQKAIKPVAQIVDNNSILPVELIELAVWMSETYISSVAQSLHTVWPLLKGKVEEWVIPMAQSTDDDIQALKCLDPNAFSVLSVLYRSRRNGLPTEVFLKRANITRKNLDQLVVQGWVKLEQKFSSGLPPSTTSNKPTSQTSLVASELNITDYSYSSTRELTKEQDNAVRRCVKGLESLEFCTILLHGITGSGKTEVYHRLIRHVLNNGGDAILLVPEISLTSQVANYFTSIFGSQIAVIHSGLKPVEKGLIWQEILRGQKRIVIGARSAVFAPLKNLRLIIIDEEHDGAFKQDENPKYHAREVARRRMEKLKGVVLLGSATPSLEAYAAAHTGKVELVTMLKRAGGSELPLVQVVDMREELLNGNRSVFSLSLLAKLKERLDNSEQSMLFLNRRGYSTFVICRECGYVSSCPSCDIALTYHTQGQVMRCHYCNYETTPPHRCPKCNSRYIRFFGQGTQKIEEELEGLLPGAKILRMDWDSTRTKDSHQAILEKFSRQEADILVGTQMMAKGLDFPNVTLVGVISADQSLNMPDFRARERTFQLLTQVAGRAGRSIKPGEVVIQTYSPLDRAIIRSSKHDYQSFFWEELSYRKERKYPPFTNVIRLTILHEKEERVIKAAHDLSNALRAGMQDSQIGNTDLDILGPAPAILPRLRNEYRWQVSVKSKRLDVLRAFVHEGVRNFYRLSNSSGISLSIEVNPLSM